MWWIESVLKLAAVPGLLLLPESSLVAVPEQLLSLSSKGGRLRLFRGGGGEEGEVVVETSTTLLEAAAAKAIPASSCSDGVAGGTQDEESAATVDYYSSSTSSSVPLPSKSGEKLLGVSLEQFRSDLARRFDAFSSDVEVLRKRMWLTGPPFAAGKGKDKGGQVGGASSAEEETNIYLCKLESVKRDSAVVAHGPGWEEVAKSDNGVQVWKKWLPSHCRGNEYPCVKATLSGVRASVEEVAQLMMDSSRIKEYNSYSIGRTDIEHISGNTKIVWNRTKPPLTKKIHDFCNIMHIMRHDNGSITLVTSSAEHPNAPQGDDSVRSEIMMGLTFIEPDDSGLVCSTRITTVNHIISNGVPTWVANKLLTGNAIDFLTNVEAAAVKSSRVCAALKSP